MLKSKGCSLSVQFGDIVCCHVLEKWFIHLSFELTKDSHGWKFAWKPTFLPGGFNKTAVIWCSSSIVAIGTFCAPFLLQHPGRWWNIIQSSVVPVKDEFWHFLKHHNQPMSSKNCASSDWKSEGTALVIAVPLLFTNCILPNKRQTVSFQHWWFHHSLWADYCQCHEIFLRWFLSQQNCSLCLLIPIFDGLHS